MSYFIKRFIYRMKILSYDNISLHDQSKNTIINIFGAQDVLVHPTVIEVSTDKISVEILFI